MSGFTIPNTPDAFNQNQAEPDSLDFQILGSARTGVVSGMEVTPGSGVTVAVSAGEVLINGVYYKLANAVTNLALTTSGTDGFFDIVYARINGTDTVDLHVTGTATGANPRFPATGTSSGQINPDTDVVLASVWRTANTAPTVNHIVDKRIFVRSNGNRVANTTPTNGTAIGAGYSGDTYINTAWATNNNNLSSPLSVKVGTTWYNIAKYSENFTAGIITASGFVGPLTGNVTGNLTGNVTGNVTGNLTGNVTGNVTGNISGGTISGAVGSLTGDLVGNLYGPAPYSPSIYSNYTGWSISGYVDTPIVYTNYISVGDGTASEPTYRFGLDTNTGMYHLAGDGFGSSSRIRFTVNGTYVYSISSSGGANASSLRYKENVLPADVVLEDLLHIEVVTFNMKNQDQKTTGVIAEQLNNLDSCKQFVIYDNDGLPDAVAYDRLAVAYIELLKDHEARLKALEES